MIRVRVSANVRQTGLSQESVERTVRMVCRQCSVHDADVSIVALNDRQMALMNKKYLKHEGTTDIITFVLDRHPVLEAELYIDYQQAGRQAVSFGITTANEMTRLIVHGVLHAAGYDDRRTKDREKMFGVQERLIRRIERSHRSRKQSGRRKVKR
jgi:probable rRNA maturation factor